MADSTMLSKLEAIPHRRLAEEIVDRVERLILNEEFQVGDALPPERDMAQQLGVSRNILREAIGVLEQKGLLQVRPGSGTYVARPTAEFLRDSLDSFFRFNKSALFDLIEARRSIEVEIAELAAERSSEEACQHIGECLANLERTVGTVEPYVDADVRFHEALAKAANNEILKLLLDSVRGALRENIRILVQLHPAAVSGAMVFHRRIAEAVQSHNPPAARAAMREHLESVRQELQQLEAQGNALQRIGSSPNRT